MKKLLLLLIALALCGCTKLHIETPSGYTIDRTTILNNRSEELALYDPDSGKPLGEYKRVDEERGTEAMAILAKTISDLVDKMEKVEAP